MAAVDVTDRVNPREVLRLAANRRESGDNYKLGGESGAPTTATITFVITTGADPTADTITCNYVTT